LYFWERKNGIRDSDEKSAGCRILVKKERECGIRTPLPDPVLKYCFFGAMNLKKGAQVSSTSH